MKLICFLVGHKWSNSDDLIWIGGAGQLQTGSTKSCKICEKKIVAIATPNGCGRAVWVEVIL